MSSSNLFSSSISVADDLLHLQGQLDAAREAGGTSRRTQSPLSRMLTFLVLFSADACITKPYKFPLLVQKIKETSAFVSIFSLATLFADSPSSSPWLLPVYHRAGIAIDGQEDLVGWMPQEAMLSPGSEFIGNPFSPLAEDLHRSEWLDPGVSPIPSVTLTPTLPSSSSPETPAIPLAKKGHK